ncbi:hypothetical protein B0A55_01586 [Friedmanniomyces simplex]|uniref:Uncharacterized protein n=1 Tax=Friedmanniomyces simplex TaxID=329884 RepID=A0A4U0XVS3_9PEZI|nr:hypothetical protein B0A55_01586 [Friedmanniomyces simplex]
MAAMEKQRPTPSHHRLAAHLPPPRNYSLLAYYPSLTTPPLLHTPEPPRASPLLRRKLFALVPHAAIPYLLPQPGNADPAFMNFDISPGTLESCVMAEMLAEHMREEGDFLFRELLWECSSATKLTVVIVSRSASGAELARVEIETVVARLKADGAGFAKGCEVKVVVVV